MIHPNHLKVPVKLGEQTCVGVPTHYPPPYPWGNRVDLLVDNIGPVSILNMTAEHLKAASEGWLDDIWNRAGLLDDGKLWISLWQEDGHHWGLVNDGRIPETWYEKRLKWWGALPSVETAKAIYEQIGYDPANELERFTDPKSYWEKRGWEYHEGSAIIKCTVNAESHRLEQRWVCTGILDLTIVNPEIAPMDEHPEL